MRFGLSEEQTLLQDNVNRFLTDHAPLDAIKAYAQEGDDSALWQGLCELGIGALLVPESAGGVGLSPMDAAVVAEAIGYHVAPGPFLSSAVIAPTILARANTDASAILGELAAGATRIGFGFSEAIGARADAGITHSDGKLNGKSLFVFDTEADAYLVADQNKQIYLVEAAAAGLTKQTLTTIDKTRTTLSLSYQDTPAQLISSEQSVFDDALDIGRVMLAADTLGAAQNMLDQAVAYAKQREQFNRPIGSFQAVKHMCAEMAADLEPCRSMVWFAAHALAELPQEARLTACHTKAHLAEVGKAVAKTATEVHGGMGFTDLLGLHYWFKRCGANRQWLGAPELVREEAAQLQGLA